MKKETAVLHLSFRRNHFRAYIAWDIYINEKIDFYNTFLSQMLPMNNEYLNKYLLI